MSTVQENPSFKIVGLILALCSSACIGTSFILKKRGILQAQARAKEEGKETQAGEGHQYLQNKTWWIGMTLLLLGEVSNFAAYSFAPAILVTPLGALSVVISTILASYFLKERLNMTGKIGCLQCILGAGIVVLNAPSSNSTSTVREFWTYFIYPSFIVYLALIIAVIVALVFYAGPRLGTRNPLVYIGVCSLTGSILVLCVQGFGSAIVYTFATNPNTPGYQNQFLLPDFYALGAGVVVLALSMIHFLNKAINLFNTAVVTPVYYVCFTTATIISSLVLFRGAGPTAVPTSNIASTVIGFLVIVGGVALLYFFNMSETAALQDQSGERDSTDGEEVAKDRPLNISPASSNGTLNETDVERGYGPRGKPPLGPSFRGHLPYPRAPGIEVDPRTGIPLDILPELQRRLSNSSLSRPLPRQRRERSATAGPGPIPVAGQNGGLATQPSPRRPGQSEPTGRSVSYSVGYGVGKAVPPSAPAPAARHGARRADGPARVVGPRTSDTDSMSDRNHSESDMDSDGGGYRGHDGDAGLVRPASYADRRPSRDRGDEDGRRDKGKGRGFKQHKRRRSGGGSS